MTREEIKDELYRMLSDVVNGGYPKRNNAQRGRYREAVKKAIEALEQEPCADAISRQAAIDACLNGWNKDYKEIVEEIRALPPVAPAEKVGQWEYNPLDMCFQCSQCKCCCEDDYKEPPKYKYCPQCGAKMQEVTG